jgi:fucose permease
MQPLTPNKLLIVLSLNFVALGGICSMFGTALEELAVNNASTLSAVGSVITMLFLGSLIALLIVGPLSDRVGQRPTIAIGALLMILGSAGVALSRSLPLLLGSGLMIGLGQGSINISSIVLISKVFPTRQTTMLGLLNVFYGIGAISIPALASFTLGAWGSALPALWSAAALLLILTPLIPLMPHLPPSQTHTTQSGTRPNLLGHLRNSLIWLLGGFLLLYVGIETGMGNWIPTYLERTTSLELAITALGTSGFWLTLTVGRLAGALLGARVAPQTLLLGAICGMIGSGALVVLSTGFIVPTVIGILLFGFFLGPIYPTTLALTTASFPNTPGTATSLVTALGSLGGSLLPWVQGILLEQVSPNASMLMILFGALTMLGLQVMRNAIGQRKLNLQAVAPQE